jgi:hypothetical protein
MTAEVYEAEEVAEARDSLADEAREFLRDEAIGGVACGLGAEFAEPLETAEVDVHVPAYIVGHRHHILGLFGQLLGDCFVGLAGALEGVAVVGLHRGSEDFRWDVGVEAAAEELALLGEHAVAV